MSAGPEVCGTGTEPEACGTGAEPEVCRMSAGPEVCGMSAEPEGRKILAHGASRGNRRAAIQSPGTGRKTHVETRSPVETDL